MFELLNVALAKHLHAVVLALCLAVSAASAGLLDVTIDVAVLQEQQVADVLTREQVVELNNMMIRVDENLKLFKDTAHTH